jgi:hypothetical protein
MSRTIRVLQDGSLISSGSSPADVRQGVIAYVQNPDDTERLTIDFKGWLNGETLSSATWTASNVTVAGTTTATPTSYSRISGVPESGHGQLTIVGTSSGSRIKELTVRFYGFLVETV